MECRAQPPEETLRRRKPVYAACLQVWYGDGKTAPTRGARRAFAAQVGGQLGTASRRQAAQDSPSAPPPMWYNERNARPSMARQGMEVSMLSLSRGRASMRYFLDGAIVRDTRDGRVENRHWDCIGARDVIEGHRPSPDIQPGGRVKRRCGLCRRLIPLLEV